MLAVLIILVVLALLALPFLPIKLPFTLFWFNFPEEKRPKNLVYIISTLIVILLTILLMPYILDFAEWFRQLEFVVWLRSLAPNHVLYSEDVFKAVFVNVLFCVLILLVHWITGTLFGLFPKFSLSAWRDAFKKAREERKAKKAKKENKEDPQQQEIPEEPENLPKELFPAPEQKDFESRVLLEGKGGKTTVTRKSAASWRNTATALTLHAGKTAWKAA